MQPSTALARASLHCCVNPMPKQHSCDDIQAATACHHCPARQPQLLSCLAVMSSQGLPLPGLTSDPEPALRQALLSRGVVKPAHELGWREGGVELPLSVHPPELLLLPEPWACSRTAARRLSCSCLYSHLDRLWARRMCL
jgi:hypothetical protein